VIAARKLKKASSLPCRRESRSACMPGMVAPAQAPAQVQTLDFRLRGNDK
jgi:hypothetical protein